MYLKYRPEIDGLRALSVIAVILYHLNNHWLPGGFIGVDVFFVISGYLITQIIYTEIIHQQFSFKQFYQRRIKRILPVFFVVMLFTSIAAWYILLPDEFVLFLKSLKTTTYFAENIFFANNTGGYWDVKADTMPLLHTWSLAVEEQFYIIFPIILLMLIHLPLFLKNRHFKIIIIFLILAIISFTLAQISPFSLFLTKYNYYSLFTARAGELLIGAIAGIFSLQKTEYILFNHSRLNALFFNSIGLIGIILSFILFSNKILFPSFCTLIPTLGAAFILVFKHPQTYIIKALSLSPMIYIGKISYSLYLWHWPIIVLSKKYLFIDNFTNSKEYLVIIITIIIVSITTYHLIETPCRKYKGSFTSTLMLFYLLPTAVIMSFYYSQKSNYFSNFQTENTLKIYSIMKTKHWEINKEGFCYNIGKECIFGDTSKKPQIVAFGNSHMEHMFRYLNQAGKMYGFSIRMIGSGGCPYINGFIGDQRCAQIKPLVYQWIKESRIIIYSANFWGLDNKSEWKDGKTFKDQFPIFIDSLLAQNKTIIILQDIPDLNTQEVNRYFSNFIKNAPTTSYHFLTHNEVSGNEMIKKIIHNKGKHVIFFNPLTGLSTAALNDWPFYKGIFAYADSNHLNAYTAKEFPKEVLPKQQSFWKKIAQEANK